MSDSALRQAARFGLPTVDDPPLVVPRTELARALSLAAHDHLTGFLASAVAHGSIVVDDDEASSSVIERWHAELVGCVVLEAFAARLADLWTGKVRWRLTKGAALAHLDYPLPEMRTFGDVDAIIHPDDWRSALDRLNEAGFRRAFDPLGERYDTRFGKGATFQSPEELEVDLHRRLAIGRFGVTSLIEDMFDKSDSIVLAGRRIETPDPTGRLLHACYHASLGGFRRFRAFRDVAQLLLGTGADWQECFRIADRWRGLPVVASAFTETWDRLDLQVEHPAVAEARRIHGSHLDRHALRVFQEERPFRQQALTALPRLSLVEIPVYLWTLGSQRWRTRSSAEDVSSG